MEYVKQLEAKFEARKKQNSNYSLRAYARDLGIHASTLSKIFKGTRNIPLGLLGSLPQKLNLGEKEKETFFVSAMQSRGLTLDKKWVKPMSDRKLLKNDIHFKVLSEWEYYAVLNLMKLDEFRPEVDWISARLGVGKKRTEIILENLLKLELIKKTSQGELQRNYPQLTSSDESNSLALKIGHQNDIQLAISKMWSVPIEDRDFYSMTIPTNVKNLKKAKLITRNYVKQLESLLEAGKKTEVYQLSVQLFPITTPIKKSGRYQ